MSSGTISRRDFIGKVAAGTLAMTLFDARQAFARPGERPNVLLITSDDHSLRDCGCYGNRFVSTPNLDRLAREGAIFSRAFTVTAVCTPSRTCLFTGLYPHTSGSYGFVPMKRGTKILPEYLQKAGYKTGCIGKLHLMPKKGDAFDTYVPVAQLGHGRDIQAYAREVSKFLGQTKETPFFLHVGFADPHRPFPTPGVKSGKKAEVPNPHDPAKVWVPPTLVDIPEVRKELAQYYDAIKRLDDGVGLVLEQLDKSGLADNTLVIYTGDHGRAFPYSKTTLYDGGLNVPFVARWPGKLQPGSKIDAMIHFVDLTPTFLELAGVTVPKGIQGRSFASVLRGEAKKHREVVFGSHTTHFFSPSCPSRSIRNDRYHYIYNLASANEFRSDSFAGVTFGAMQREARRDPKLAARLHALKYRPQEELYDVQSDPFEMKNLVGNHEFEGARKKMQARLSSFMKDINDPWLKVLLEQTRAGSE